MSNNNGRDDDDDKNNNITMSTKATTVCPICLGTLRENAIGVTNPCGHCFHLDCWDQFEQHTHRRQNMTCPNCKQKTTSFVRIYLDFQDQNNSDDEDDDEDDHGSLSSCSNVEQSKSEEEANDEPGGGGRSRDDDDDDTAGAIAAGEAARDDRRRIRCDQDSAHRILRRKARQFKRKIRQLQGQKLERAVAERNLSSTIRDLEERCDDLTNSLHDAEAKIRDKELRLNSGRVDTERLRNQLRKSESQVSTWKQRAARAEEDCTRQKLHYAEKLDQFHYSQMVEIQSILKKQPQLIQENHSLKETLVQQARRMEDLERMLMLNGGRSLAAKAPPAAASADARSGNLIPPRDETTKTKTTTTRVWEVGDAKHESCGRRKRHLLEQREAFVKLSRQATRIVRSTTSSAATTAHQQWAQLVSTGMVNSRRGSSAGDDPAKKRKLGTTTTTSSSSRPSRERSRVDPAEQADSATLIPSFLTISREERNHPKTKRAPMRPFRFNGRRIS